MSSHPALPWRQGERNPHTVYSQLGAKPNHDPWPHGDPVVGFFIDPEDAARAVAAVNDALEAGR